MIQINACVLLLPQFLLPLLLSFMLSLPLFFQTIAEYDLKTVNYDVKSPKCHELSLASPPHERISFNFRCEQEAQEWATVMMSSLREAHKGRSPLSLGTSCFFWQPQQKARSYEHLNLHICCVLSRGGIRPSVNLDCANWAWRIELLFIYFNKRAFQWPAGCSLTSL